MKLSLPQSTSQDSKKLEIHYHPEITSLHDDHRRRLRLELLKLLESAGYLGSENEVLNLEDLPKASGFSISLSHSREGSAVLLAHGSSNVGIDIESKARLNIPLIERVSTPAEMAQAIEAAHLFVAKEAAWKALNHTLNLTSLPQITTENWHRLNSTWVEFNVRVADQIIDGSGYLCEVSNTYLAFFIDHSTFMPENPT